MLFPSPLRAVRGLPAERRMMVLLALLLTAPTVMHAQTMSSPANTPVSVPAGALDALPPEPPAAKPAKVVVSAKQAREADDAYLEGAREIQRKNVSAAEKYFARAVQLNPYDRDYALALIVTRESHLNELVQAAAKARLLGDAAKADALLEEARSIDPTNPVVAQHFAPDALAAKRPEAPPIGATLAPPVVLVPTAGNHDFHLIGDPQTVIRSVYSAYGIKVSFDPSVGSAAGLQFDMKNVSFADATRVLAMMGHILAVPVQADTVLIAKDTQENRDALMPLVEETVYMPGLGQDQMTELANVARTVFDVKQVTASPTGGFMLLRGDERVLDQVNATYADMLDGGSDVLFDVTLYEVSKTHTVNVGVTTPTSANLFSIEQEAQKLVTANQSIVSTVVASGQIPLTANATLNTLIEAEYLIQYGGVTDATLTGLLGTLGTLDGIPLAGISLAGTTSINLLLNATDTRLLDTLQVRSSNHQAVNFRVGSRYPIVTSSYAAAATSALTPAEAALLKQYTGLTSLSSATAPPQVQFEDLGITLKMTPQVLRTNEVSLALDMKIESLAGSSVNGNPVLNNQSLTSTVTVPAGHTAMLATLVNTNDLGSFAGLPGLNDLPGFQGTNDDAQKNTSELLITITPHIVRSGALHISSRRLAAVKTGNGSASQ